MNKAILTLGTAILFAIGSSTFIGCGGGEGHDENEETHEHHDVAAYQCPMQCEGDKTYEEAGKCPECQMDLVKVGDHHDHEHGDGLKHDGHEHDHDDEGHKH